MDLLIENPDKVPENKDEYNLMMLDETSEFRIKTLESFHRKEKIMVESK